MYGAGSGTIAICGCSQQVRLITLRTRRVSRGASARRTARRAAWHDAAERDLRFLADRHLLDRLTASVNRSGRAIKTGLLLIAITLLITALARPQFGSRVETVRREGQDILIALDLSASMVAEDVAPNRLDKAKFAIADLINRLEGDRVGLVAFAGNAFVQCPLTVDYGAATLFLNAMAPDMMSVQGTNLGQALSVAMDAFSETDRRHRVLVVITDGEDHENQMEEAVDRAVEEGVRLYPVGIGSTEGVPIPELNTEGRAQGFKRDRDGAVVTTRIQRPGGDPVEVIWHLQERLGVVRIVDVMIEGISMSLTQRSDFSASVRTTGGDLDKFLDTLEITVRNFKPSG